MLDTQPDNLREWPDYIGPACNYASSVDVGIRSSAARETREMVAGFSVGFLDVSADAALPRGISRIDVDYSNTSALGFVDDLRLEISESPRVQCSALRTASPYPIANALEILKRNAAFGAFSRNDNLFRNAMVHMRRVTSLLGSSPTKQPLRALGAFLLKLLSQAVGASTKRVEARAGEVLPVTGRGNVDDSDVNAQPADDPFFLDVRHFDRNEQVELAVAQDEIGLTAIVVEKSALMVTADEGDYLPACNGPEVRRVRLPRQDASVVGNRSEGTKAPLRDLVELVRIGNFRGAAHDHLRGEIGKLVSSVAVGPSMQSKLREDFRRPSTLRNPITRNVGAPHGLSKCGGLFTRWQKLHLDDQLHDIGLAHSRLESKADLKAGVSSPKEL
jgi:hypothetical protein